VSKVEDAKAILKALGMPPAQQNDNAAYTLLAFANVGPKTPWSKAESVRGNPHYVIEFARDRYKKLYAENTRETIRRQAIHQFVQGAILLRNPDDPSLATNSPRTHYAISSTALKVIQAFGTTTFNASAAKFCKAAGGGLAKHYAKARGKKKIPVTLPGGEKLLLSPGKHNELQRAIVNELLPRFAPGSEVLYLSDTDHKTLHVADEQLAELGFAMSRHDKLPDIVAYLREREWLYLIEAVTSHGPVSPKRYHELEESLASDSKAGRVYISAFLNFGEFKRHADSIAWETEVWIAEAPDHLLHYNGDRFFGPRT